jgi:RimJ/RimL family protein N-acetyltransferase
MDMPNKKFSFKLFNKNHLDLVNKWQQESHVKEFWGNDEYAESYEEYVLRTSSDGSVVQYLIQFDEKPIGYIQYYWASKVGDGWWEGYSDDVVGFDFYIGEVSFIGRGLGSQVVQSFSQFLFNLGSVKSIIADPSPNNSKIIHIIKKCGYEKKGRIKTPDGDAVLFIMENKN